MKLRFRHNTIRLRLNQREVERLARGEALREAVRFPGAAEFSYVLQSASAAQAAYRNGSVLVSAPQSEIRAWAGGDAIGLYLEFPADGTALKVAIEKDLECLDGPDEERDPHAFPRDPNDIC